MISLTLTFSLHRSGDFLTALSFPFLPLRANMLTLSLPPVFLLSLHPLQSSALRPSHQSFLPAISSVRAKDQTPSHMFVGTETRTCLSLITCAWTRYSSRRPWWVIRRGPVIVCSPWSLSRKYHWVKTDNYVFNHMLNFNDKQKLLVF